MRQLDDWLTKYVRYASLTSEPPLSYHWWVGVTVIAATLRRRVYNRFGFGKLYPNLYVVLMGPSGKTRKGTACEIGMDLIRNVTEVVVAPEATSKQALIKTMKDSIVSFQDPDTDKIDFHCPVMIYSEELSVFLGQNDVDFLSTLTNWYDSRDKWKYDTVSRGTEAISGVCVTMLGASAPDWLTSIIPREG